MLRNQTHQNFKLIAEGSTTCSLQSIILKLLSEIIPMLYFRYHVPRAWLQPSGNFLVVFEEWGGDPSGISLVKRTVN